MLARPLITTVAVLQFSIGLQAAELSLKLQEATRYSQGIFNKSAAEIIVYAPESQQFYLVNGAIPSVDILHLKNGQLTKMKSLPLGKHEQPTSVAVYGDLVAVAVHEVQSSARPGKVILFTPQADRLAEITVGDLPDMVTFSKDGRFILTANEGEPINEHDPEGSVSIITLDTQAIASSKVQHISFAGLDVDALRRKGIRIVPGKTAAQDFEPEYITIADRKAYVSLQENNAIAVIDIEKAKLDKILPLGFKDHSLPHNGLDVSDKDKTPVIGPQPLRGLYMPDTITSFRVGGHSYIATANEGDARGEDIRIGKAKLDATLKEKLEKAATGKRIKISSIDGDVDQDGDIDHAYSYGTRSFSIWNEEGMLVFDSGDQFAQTTFNQLGQNGFNASNDKNGGDNRSDDKGSEPEAIAVGNIAGRAYAFIGLERTGGIMIYDVTEPANAAFVSYYNDRNFDPALDPAESAESLTSIGHLGPECILFIPAADSPYNKPTLAVAYEVSGSVGLYIIEPTD